MARITSALFIAVAVCLPAAAQSPKNIIFIIGDGMGPAHITAARHSIEGTFRLGELPVTGLVMTHSANDVVTDSGASASAYATGVKVNNEVLSIDPSGKRLETVLEVAERAGKATGLVTTSYFWDATTAAFAAHVADRDEFAEIIDQMLRSGVDLIAGGGVEAFGRERMPKSIEESARANGFTLVRNPAELDRATGLQILAAFPSQRRDVDYPEAPLPRLTRWAIERLKGDPQGFFLVVEHEGIDSSSHENSRAEVLASLRSLDAAVGAALDYARTVGDTLVLVTGDHETGSLRISSTRLGRLRIEFATTDHTGVAVPVFAYGPGSATFMGLQDNTDIGKKLLSFVRAK